MHPLDVKDEVLVLAFRSHDPDGLAGGYEQTVAYRPGVGGRVDVHPPAEILAVEEIFEQGNLGGERNGEKSREQQSHANQSR